MRNQLSMNNNDDKKNMDSLKETKEFWSQRSGREISLEDAREIENNLFEFVNILIEWDEQDKKALGKSDQENESQGKDGCVSKVSGMKDKQARDVIQNLLKPKITTDGENITLSVEWPEDDDKDSNTDSDEGIDRLIEFYEDRFGKTLSRDEAKEIQRFLLK